MIVSTGRLSLVSQGIKSFTVYSLIDDVPTFVSLRLGVTVRTDDFKVTQLVVIVYSINVVQLQD